MEKQFVTDYLKAGYRFFTVESWEHDRAVKILFNELKERGYSVTVSGVNDDDGHGNQKDLYSNFTELDEAESKTALLVKNGHWLFDRNFDFPDRYRLVQLLQDRIMKWRSKESDKVVVFLSNTSDFLPSEIRRDFVSAKIPLPCRTELERVLEKSIDSFRTLGEQFKVPSDLEKDSILDCGHGLTSQEFENALFLSVVKSKGSIDTGVVSDMRASFLEGLAGLKYYRYQERFDDLIGYDRLKELALSMVYDPNSKGLLLIGGAGTGKTHFGRALSGETGIPCVTVEMAEWFGKYVGETEQKVRDGLSALNSFVDDVSSEDMKKTRLIVFIDEIEKGLKGASSGSGQEGHESTVRAMAQFLKWLNDRPKGIYVIATCNDIKGIDAAYLRAERWDCAPFYVEPPDKEQKVVILNHYSKKYGVSGKLTDKQTDGWSGSELKAVCRLAMTRKTSIEKAADFIIPISRTCEQEITYLHNWALGFNPSTNSWGSPRANLASFIKKEVNVKGVVKERSIEI